MDDKPWNATTLRYEMTPELLEECERGKKLLADYLKENPPQPLCVLLVPEELMPKDTP